VTEIPEHLLKRSKERRSALGGEAGADAPATAAAATPGTAVAPAAAAKAAVPAKAASPAAPPPPKPVPPYVAAYKRRKKIPVWAMMTLSILPLWAFMYVRALTPEKVEASGPLGAGAKIFSGSCSSCHGAKGEGGAGRELDQGDTELTFPHIEDQLNFVYNGSDRYANAGLTTYGDPNRPGGARGIKSYNGGPMPGWGEKAGGALTEAEILAVVCEERYNISGADPASTKWASEYAKWCAADSPIYAGLKDGSLTFDTLTKSVAGKGTLPVGTAVRASSK
jgi:hypothetical protein